LGSIGVAFDSLVSHSRTTTTRPARFHYVPDVTRAEELCLCLCSPTPSQYEHFFVGKASVHLAYGPATSIASFGKHTRSRENAFHRFAELDRHLAWFGSTRTYRSRLDSRELGLALTLSCIANAKPELGQGFATPHALDQRRTVPKRVPDLDDRHAP